MARLSKVRDGDRLRIPASTYNAFIDAAREGQNFGRTLNPFGADRNLIKIKNTSGADVDRFGVLGVDDPIYGPDDDLAEFQGRVAFNGRLPGSPSHVGPFQRGRIAIPLEPIASGQIGRACISGICVARVNMLKSNHEYATFTDNTSQLESRTSGTVEIVWVESGVGALKWAVVRLQGADSSGVEICRALTTFRSIHDLGLQVPRIGQVHVEHITTANLLDSNAGDVLDAVNIGPVVLSNERVLLVRDDLGATPFLAGQPMIRLGKAFGKIPAGGRGVMEIFVGPESLRFSSGVKEDVVFDSMFAGKEDDIPDGTEMAIGWSPGDAGQAVGTTRSLSWHVLWAQCSDLQLNKLILTYSFIA